ncbi:MAG TPA: hypothetical protein VIK80_01925, partial [Flavihumibacter sp.]
MQLHKKTIRIAALVIMLAACSKNKDVAKPPVVGTPLVTNPGTPEVPVAKKIIGPAGGTVTSVDEGFSVIVAPGALTQEEEISVQAVSNNLPGGIGKVY